MFGRKNKDKNSNSSSNQNNPNNPNKVVKRKGFRRLFFSMKYGVFKKAMSPKEFELASEYLMSDVDIYTMEKDLLLRGMRYSNVKRIIDAYEHLRWLTNLPEIKPITEEELKGGILDGIRRS
jgi:hypothetical protein